MPKRTIRTSGRLKVYRLASLVVVGLLVAASDVEAQERRSVVVVQQSGQAHGQPRRQPVTIVIQQRHEERAVARRTVFAPMTFGSLAGAAPYGSADIPPNGCAGNDLEIDWPEPGEPKCLGGR